MQTFTKAERLSGKQVIEALYEKGNTFHSYPFKIFWKEITEEEENPVPVKVLIAVPKKLYKRAVDRNKLKRLIREAYRKNKTTLYEKLKTTKIHLMLVYTSKKMETYSVIEQKLIVGMSKVEIEKK